MLLRNRILWRGLTSATLAVFLSTGSLAQVALPVRMNLVDSSSPVNASPYTPVDENSQFDPGTGSDVGWVGVSPAAYDIPANLSPPLKIDSGAVPLVDGTYGPGDLERLRQGHYATAGSVFAANVGPGTYWVRVSVGLGISAGNNVSYDVGGIHIFDNNDPVGSTLTPEFNPHGTSGLWARTGVGKASLLEDPSKNRYLHGGTRTPWFQLTVGAGEDLELRFENVTGTTPVTSIEIYERAHEPFHFTKSNLRLVVNPQYNGDTASLQAGLALLKLHDIDGAVQVFQGIDPLVDELGACAGLMWCAGWLADEEIFTKDSREWTLIRELIPRLEALPVTGPEAGIAAFYLDAAREFQRGLMLQRWRGYTGSLPFDGLGEVTSPYAIEAQSLPAGAPPAPLLLDNICAAEAVWHNLGGQQLGDVLDVDARLVHPLAFKAFACLGVNWLSRSAHNKFGDPGSVVQIFIKQHFDLWRDFDSRGFLETSGGPGIFAESDILRIGVHLGTYDGHSNPSLAAGVPDGMPDGLPDYDQENENGLPGLWAGEGFDTIHSAGQDAWWFDEIGQALAIDPTVAGDWAGYLHRASLGRLGSLGWWEEHRLINGEAGGGEGDDVEFFGPILNGTFPLRGNEPGLESFLRERSTASLESYEPLYFFDGDGAGATDVEHTAEYTPYPCILGELSFFGEPYYMAYALRSMRHMERDTTFHSHNGWTQDVPVLTGKIGNHTYPAGPNNAPIEMRRYKSFFLDATGPDIKNVSPGTSGVVYNTEGDVPLNGRSVLPSYRLNRLYPNPESQRLLREWGEWWWEVAMATSGQGAGDQSKPEGVLPTVAWLETSTNSLAFGDRGLGNWWVGYYDFETTLKYTEFVYSGMFLERYLDPKTPDTERWEYLKPIFYASRLVAEYYRQNFDPTGTVLMSLPGSSAQEGSDYWAAELMYLSQAFQRDMLRALPHMEADPDILALPDADEQLDYVRDLLLANLSEARLWLADDKSGVVDSAKAQFDWSHGVFPYGTSFVSYTDRAFMTSAKVRGALLAATTGASLSPSPSEVLTLERDALLTLLDGLAPLDVAYMTLDFDPVFRSSVRAVIHQFEVSPSGAENRQVIARLWYSLKPGNYLLEVGPNNGMDQITPGTASDSVNFQLVRPGEGVPFSLPYTTDPAAGSEFVLQVTRLGDLPNTVDPDSVADLAIGPSDLKRVHVSDTHFKVEGKVYNLGSVASTANVYCFLEWNGLFFDLGVVETVSVPATTGLDPSYVNLDTPDLPYQTTGPDDAQFLFLMVPTSTEIEALDHNHSAYKLISVKQ